jgi:hypothetical protein
VTDAVVILTRSADQHQTRRRTIMFTTDPHAELRIANDRHRERVAAAALRRSTPSERSRRFDGLHLTTFVALDRGR